MGYTHYFNRIGLEHDKAKFEAFVSDVKQAFNKLPKEILADGHGEGKPEVNNDRVCFNGSGDLAHETMLIERVVVFTQTSYDQYRRWNFKKNGDVFSYCKTSRAPYDLAVQIVLILYKKHFGDLVKIGSDGDVSEWKKALDFVSDGFNYCTIFGRLVSGGENFPNKY